MKYILLIVTIFLSTAALTNECSDEYISKNIKNYTTAINNCEQFKEKKQEINKLLTSKPYESKRGFSKIVFAGALIFSLILIFIFKKFKEVTKENES